MTPSNPFSETLVVAIEKLQIQDNISEVEKNHACVSWENPSRDLDFSAFHSLLCYWSFCRQKSDLGHLLSIRTRPQRWKRHPCFQKCADGLHWAKTLPGESGVRVTKAACQCSGNVSNCLSDIPLIIPLVLHTSLGVKRLKKKKKSDVQIFIIQNEAMQMKFDSEVNFSFICIWSIHHSEIRFILKHKIHLLFYCLKLFWLSFSVYPWLHKVKPFLNPAAS